MNLRRVFALSLVLATSSAATQSFATDYSSLVKPVVRGAQSGESTYFVMTDRFENGDTANDNAGVENSRYVSGFVPDEIGWWHGGDFKGLESRLDYIKGMGFTSLWITPPVVQKYVQGSSAAYHGYWGVDFTTVDPHLGTEVEFTSLVAAAHQRGLKVIIDIVINHTADVIYYKDGKPTVSLAEAKIKKPDFLNEINNYHNLGDVPLKGSPVTDADFFGLDDLATEKPAVINGEIELWSSWITKFDIDGMRIDTFKHVNSAFWKVFIPKIKAVALKAGKKNFPIFGEVADADSVSLSSYVAGGEVPSVLDFAFQKEVKTFIQYGFSASSLADLFNTDDLYTTATTSAYGLATFLGNHDMGRIGSFIASAVPNDQSAILLERAKLANAALFFLRGGPVLYYGDEKGMTGSGGDKNARQDMFATQVLDWQSELRIGAAPIGKESVFSQTNALEKQIADIQKLISNNPALRNGTQQIRFAQGGSFAVTRYAQGSEYIVAFNGKDEAATSSFKTSSQSGQWELLTLGCSVSGTSSVSVTIPARSYCVAKSLIATKGLPAPSITLNSARDTTMPNNWKEITAKVPGDGYVEVTFSVREKRKSWRSIGTSDHRTFGTDSTKGGLHRLYLHPEDFKKGITVEVIAVVTNANKAVAASKIIKVKL